MYQRGIFIALLWMLCQTAWADPSVSRSQLTSRVEAREPLDDLGNKLAIDEDVITLYYFTEISDANNQIVQHKWLYQGEEMADVSFSIGSPRWRTYSSKRILRQWQGQWEVQVWLDNSLLDSHSFVLTSP